MIISPGVFFIYLKFWFFGQLGVKRAKNSPRWQKKFCFLHFISQEPDIIWLSFMVHNIFNSIRKNICACMFSVHNTINLSCHEQVPDKLIVLSPRGFFIFSKSWASGLLGVKGQRMAQNDKKLSPTSYIRNCTSYDCRFWYICVKWCYLQQFFFVFSKFRFLGFSKFHQ